MMELRRINNKNAVLKRCFLSIMLLIFFSLFCFLGLYWQNKYASVGLALWFIISDIYLITLIRKRYIDIRVYEDYMLIKECYLLRSEKNIRSERIVYYEITGFNRSKNILVFVTKNREIKFSAKYLTEAERVSVENVFTEHP